jgi:hypothetical protein
MLFRKATFYVQHRAYVTFLKKFAVKDLVEKILICYKAP